MDDITETVPEESVQLDQLQPDDSLIYRGVDDVLDEGYITPDDWSPAMGFGNTAEEMRQGETIDMRVKQELPDSTPEQDEHWNPGDEPREVGGERAGRLMRVQGPGGSETLGVDVGFSGGAASAEEAAMHIISDDDEDDASLDVD
ncbi:hypothetical protein H5392_13030 [Tessaracoccus sp. MC1865]|uniref:DUF5709 domain-containing protein n=1 Tax=Tessaracoccus sp. MC1865 TaxID=2760310 RepID=UPI0016013520|nr:DUF5709 domain-containing protein [Tessaracoccus sp. MC1865]MBB1484779.1 hypothetical protein [Tessaracoccus sp. MC1865]QTO36284.1 hypothetical protein J7D54_07020 [Tessaracoccus sp. MC1865]